MKSAVYYSLTHPQLFTLSLSGRFVPYSAEKVLALWLDLLYIQTKSDF